MRATVLPDARLQKHAGRSVWLAIDTENAKNAAFLGQFPVEVWPTFLIIDPRDERAVLNWPGSASVEQLDKLLEDGERRERGGAEALLARADQANAGGKVDEALAAYREALAKGGPAWPHRARAVESLVLLASTGQKPRDCAEIARSEGAQLPRGPSFANVVATGLSCAVGVPAAAGWRKEAIAALEPLAKEAVETPGLLADDRSGIYEALADAREADGDAQGERKVAERWWAFLEAEGKKAQTPEQRAALDTGRVNAAMKLHDPARALPALQLSEKELPGDYNPPAREAYLLRELGRIPEARQAASRALARAYGPRKLRIYTLAVGLAEKAGDGAGSAKLLDEAIAFAEGLPLQQRGERIDRVVGDLRRKRAALAGPAQRMR